jgi:tetratricopeptide (TPR) repeat protein
MDPELVEAMRLYSEKDWQGALDVLDGLASTEANHLDLAYLLGLCHARLEDWDEALLFLEQVVTASEDEDRVNQCRLSLAYVYAMTGRSRLAEYELGRLVDSGFASTQVLSALGHTLWKLGRAGEAEKAYAEAVGTDPESATALNGLGYVLACEGKDVARALTCCRKAVDSDPENPAYLDSLGWAYYRLGFEAEAREYLSRALERAPGEAEIREHARSLSIPLPSDEDSRS